MGNVINVDFAKKVKTEVEQVVEEAKAELKALGMDTEKAFRGAVSDAGKAAEAVKAEIKAVSQVVEEKVEKTEEQLAAEAAQMREELQQKAVASQQFAMKMIDKNRRDGLNTLIEKVEALSKRVENFSDPVLENAMREVRAALTGALTHLQATANLTEYLKHDLLSCIENIEQHSATIMQMSGYISTLIALLVQKSVVTHAEMEETWNTMVRPSLEALRAQQGGQQAPNPEAPKTA